MVKSQKMPIGIVQKQLKDGRVVFKATAYNGYDAVGKKIRMYKQFETLSEAIFWRQKMALNSNAKQIIAYGRLPLWQAFEIHYKTFKQNQIASATKESYRANVNRLKRAAPNLQVDKTTRTFIQAMFTSWANDGFSVASQRKIMHRLHRFFEDMVVEDVVNRNPVVNIVIAEPQNKKMANLFLDDKVYEKLIRHLEEKQQHPEIRSALYVAWLLVAIQTGTRPGEVTALAWSDLSIDGDSPEISIRHSYSDSGDGIKVPKTPSSIRTIAIPKRLADSLKKWRAYTRKLQMSSGARSDYVFMRVDGKFPNNTLINRWLNRMLREIGVPKEERITAHKLRHTWATYQMNHGASIAFISKHLGHASIRITQETYLHTTKTEYNAQAELATGMLDAL